MCTSKIHGFYMDGHHYTQKKIQINEKYNILNIKVLCQSPKLKNKQ